MRELISKLSKGIFEYDTPVINTSVSFICLELETDITYYGSIEIYSMNDMNLKGVAYSDNDKFILINPQFKGLHNTVKYKVITDYTKIGDIFEGKINIISNGNEITIPYRIQIKSVSITIGNQDIYDVNSFINLVHNNYDEAVTLFCRQDFRRILSAEDNKLLPIYEGLINSKNKYIALEEFLVGINKKNEISICISESSKLYTGLEESFGDSIIILKDNPGYIELLIETDVDFIKTDKSIITSENFVGNHYELYYLINYDCLHTGYNYGIIRISSNKQVLEYRITVNNKKIYDFSYLKIKKYKSELIKNYIQYKINNLSMKSCMESTLSIMEELNKYEDYSVNLILFQAYVFLMQKKHKEADILLNRISAELSRIKEEDFNQYCLYQYIRTIQLQDSSFTLQVCRQLKEYYHKGHDHYILLLILLKMDHSLIENKNLRLTEIKEQYQKSCRSPLLYIEALNILNENPQYLRGINDFEIQVLIFGKKINNISEKLSDQVSEAALLEKDFNPLIFKILKYLYKVYNNNQILDAICSMLIRGNKYGNEYFEWFALGAYNELKITKLYDYYMYSISTEYKLPLPQNILMYFIYNANSLFDKQAYLYYNIIINKQQNESIYLSYRKHIERYGLSEIKQENINEFLAVTYKDILNKENLDAEILDKLPKLAFTYKLECKNPNITKVIICCDEFQVQNETKLINGKAYIVLDTSNYYLLFEDIYGNRYYKTIDYTLSKLMTENKYIDICLAQNPNNEMFISTHLNKVLKNSKNHVKTLKLLISVLDKNLYRNEYYKKLMGQTVDYYYQFYDEDILDKYLLLFNKEKMDNSTRGKIIELMIARGLYNDAYAMFLKFGNLGVDPGKVLKLCVGIIHDKGNGEDCVITNLCWYSFINGKYNEFSLQYLGTYYNGTTQAMLDLWKALKNFECENRELEERLLVQMLFTKVYSNMRCQVYYSYFQKGAKEDIRNAYINFESNEYYFKDSIINDNFFILLEEELQKDFYINDICKLAYLKYHLNNNDLNEYQIKLCEKIIYDLSERSIRLNFYKKYTRWFNIPYYIMDKLIIQYKTNPKHNVFIHYIIETGGDTKKTYTVEEMNSIYPGIYTKEFVVFYGENVLYYITEEINEIKLLTESMNISLSDDELYTGESRYGILNNMMLSLDMNDEITLKDLALQYSMNRFFTDNMFEIM